MRSRHIAFFSFPHTPHTFPTASIVSTLLRRGHRVTYVTSDAFSTMFEALGAEVVQCPRFIRFCEDGTPNFHDIFSLSESVIADMAQRDLGSQPILVVYDRAFFAGRILATMWNLPAITTSSGLAFNKADKTMLSDSLNAWRDVEIRLTKDVDAFFARYGIYEENSYFHEEPLNIYLYPKLYQLPGDAFGESYFYAGRCAAERPYMGRWHPPDAGGRPVVLVSASTAYVPGPEYFLMCIKALSTLRLHVMLVLSGNFDPDILRPLPPNCEVAQHASLIQMLAHADLLVCMGGPTTASEAMYHGVPLLMISNGSRDLEVYAENSARIGLGIHLTQPETTIDSIRNSAASILSDTSLAERMKQIRRIVKREPGGEETANCIEEYMQTVIC